MSSFRTIGDRRGLGDLSKEQLRFPRTSREAGMPGPIESESDGPGLLLAIAMLIGYLAALIGVPALIVLLFSLVTP